MLRYFLVALIAWQTASAPAPQQSSSSQSSQGDATNTVDISTVLARAQSGDSSAQFELGRAYETGTGVSQNDSLAVTWYRKSADLGNAAAENSLGLMYRMGRGVEKNLDEAVKCYEKGAKLGNPSAMFNVGVSYYNGEGVADNPIQAYAWFLLAQEAGNVAARDAVRRSASELGPLASQEVFLSIGEMYEKGDGLPQSYIKAIEWYRKAADQSPEAALRLATLLINGTAGAQDYKEAMALCSDYAKKHIAKAEYCVGYLYQRGLGVDQDARQAAKWYEEAAPTHGKAALALSEMYLHGDGVAVDRPEAFCLLFFAYRNGVLAAKAQAHSLRKEMNKDETKRAEKKLRERRLDPQKVFAIIDDPTDHPAREVLPEVKP
jgi:uncharacterized protein